jgi:hypothetical protein
MNNFSGFCLSCVVFVFVLVGMAQGGGYGSSGGAPRSTAGYGSAGGSTKSAGGYGSAGGSTRSAPAPAASRSAGGYGSTGGAPRSVDTFGGPAAGDSRSVVEVPPAAPAMVSAPAPVADPAPVASPAPRAVEAPPVARIVLREIIEVEAPEVVLAPAPAGGCESGHCEVAGGGGDGRPPRLVTQYRDARKEMHESHKAARLAHQAYRHARKADEESVNRAAIEAASNAYRAVKQ